MKLLNPGKGNRSIYKEKNNFQKIKFKEFEQFYTWCRSSSTNGKYHNWQEGISCFSCHFKSVYAEITTLFFLGRIDCQERDIVMGHKLLHKAGKNKIKLNCRPPWTENHSWCYEFQDEFRFGEGTRWFTIDKMCPRTSLHNFYRCQRFQVKQFICREYCQHQNCLS